MTVKEAIAYCKDNGIRLERKWGEYRVTLTKWVNGMMTTEDRAYYTDDLEDAIATGLVMAKGE